MAQSTVTVSGKRFSPLCAEAVLQWQKEVRAKGIAFVITQGGYNGTAVSASAGTHAEDALDISVRGLTQAEVAVVISIGRKLGFAAWFRTTNIGKWGVRPHGFTSYHIHAVPNGWSPISAGAAKQVDQYKQGLDGLASRGKDAGGPGHVSTFRSRTWPQYKLLLGETTLGLPSTGVNTNTQGELTMSDVTKILEAIAALQSDTSVIKTNTASAFGPIGGRKFINEVSGATSSQTVNFPIWRGGKPVPMIQEIANMQSQIIAISSQVNGLVKAIASLTTTGGVDLEAIVDATRTAAEEGASSGTLSVEDVSSAILDTLLPAVQDAVTTAQGDIDPEQAEEFTKVVVNTLKAKLDAQV